MEELLKQILGEIEGIKSGQEELSNDVKDLKSGQKNLKVGQAKLWEEISTIKQEMGTKNQQDENTEIIKVILHNQEITNAKLESLVLHTATRENVERLEAKFDDLNVRLFNQTAEIRQLKAVK